MPSGAGRPAGLFKPTIYQPGVLVTQVGLGASFRTRGEQPLFLGTALLTNVDNNPHRCVFRPLLCVLSHLPPELTSALTLVDFVCKFLFHSILRHVDPSPLSDFLLLAYSALLQVTDPKGGAAVAGIQPKDILLTINGNRLPDSSIT